MKIKEFRRLDRKEKPPSMDKKEAKDLFTRSLGAINC
jgi:hypothetical protein